MRCVGGGSNRRVGGEIVKVLKGHSQLRRAPLPSELLQAIVEGYRGFLYWQDVLLMVDNCGAFRA